MSHARLLTRILNCPLMVSQDKLDIITSEVGLKLLAGESLAVGEPTIHSVVPKGAAVVTIFDALVSKNGGGASGSTSYESIVSQTKDLIAQGHKAIYFYLDTPGGEVAGLFGAADFISSLPERYGVETIGITDGMMASAGYVLGSAVQKLYATETSIIGSIGVIMTLVNTVKADEEAGREYLILRSKDEKALLNQHEPFEQKAIDDAMKMLSNLDGIMNKTVSANRPGLDIQTIIDLNGKVVLGTEALSLGLIDGIVTSFDGVIKERTNLTLTHTGTTTMTELEKALMANAQLTADLAASRAETTVAVKAAVQEERTRVLGIVDAAGTFKVAADMAKKRIVAGSTVVDSVEMFEGIAQGIQASLDTTATTTTLNPDTTAPSASDFSKGLQAALDNAEKSPKLFQGVR